MASDEVPAAATDDELGGMPTRTDGQHTEALGGRARGHRLIKRFLLTVVAGPDAGTVLRSQGARVVIGTHELADLVLGDRAVSRFHCELELSEGACRVRDTESRNGTRVDGVRVHHAELAPGSVISVGRSQIRFDEGVGHVRVSMSEREHFGLLVGRAPATRTVFAALERAAASDATVLLSGETGTGKEATAESIHRESARAQGPFIFVDCGAIPPDLLESELFGHEKGAFTGATAAREGAFEAANGGTIFLDEIGELSRDLQPRLLRVLERRHIKRVGENDYRDIDVRVIAATNRDLRAAVNDKSFRSDLYYRLAVVEVHLPPLRERREDLPLLVERLVRGLGAEERPEAEALREADFLAHLARHPWPGNVRELRNYLERCLAMREPVPLRDAGIVPGGADETGAGQPILASELPLKDARERWNHAFEARYLREVLDRAGDNVSAAARAAGVDRAYFHRLLRRHGLR
ncbi:sigma 54-interacting transcriptional regulator [Haliangium ochraceum]|uniref:Putative sigma54 specific transcriptional regulator n=1 Tax=Haliangium ochraceum (strain DSM 14365 / JCM 11303 / SMP-2) TaxID=502025 RepID=D0LM01_HALO1|nr:sigma 54-interacting transcriptional regulator [Haliangium ochraceum]ACY15179.1 putative sigma54 specific transcriptional regulator [Haliangium ochraceum DSM 14365]